MSICIAGAWPKPKNKITNGGTAHRGKVAWNIQLTRFGIAEVDRALVRYRPGDDHYRIEEIRYPFAWLHRPQQARITGGDDHTTLLHIDRQRAHVSHPPE